MKLYLYRMQPNRFLALMLFSSFGAQVVATPCDDAWAAYPQFTSRTVMEPAQYALTVHGAQVRAACGANALPVPQPSRPVGATRAP